MGKSSVGAWMRRRAAASPVARYCVATSALGLVLILALGVIYLVWPFDEVARLVSRAPDVTSEGGTSVPVDVPLALLGDYFEHGLEHAPPRDPRGVMQRREAFYKPPREPLQLVIPRLGPGAGDAMLRDALMPWHRAWLEGRGPDERQAGDLEDAAERSSLDSVTLLRVSQSMQFLAGDQLAVAFVHAALKKASIEFATAAPGDRRSLSLLHQLDQTKVLWKLKDYASLEQRFALARRLYPPLSIESRRAGYLLADSLFFQRKFKAAESVVKSVVDEHERAGDLGLLDRGDVYEMTYQLGYLQFNGGDLEAAVGTLRRVRGGEHGREAATALFSALLELGRLSEAREVLGQTRSESAVASGELERELTEESQLREWRRQFTSGHQFTSAGGSE